MKKKTYGIKTKWLGTVQKENGVEVYFDTADEALAWAEANDYDMDEIEVFEND